MKNQLLSMICNIAHTRVWYGHTVLTFDASFSVSISGITVLYLLR